MSVAVALLGTLAIAAPASAFCADCSHSGGSSHSTSGYVLTLSALARIERSVPAAGDGGGTRFYYAFVPACEKNSPGDGDALCGSALRACARHPDSLLYYIYRGADPAALANVGTVCLGGTDFVDRDRLSRDVATRLVTRLPLTAPRIATAPPERTLVHLPTVIWATNPRTGTPDPPTYRLTGTVDDVAVTLTVTGTWTWRPDADHPPTTLHTAGTPYRPGDPDPRTHPAYYTGPDPATPTGLLATYARRGTAHLTLTLTWTPSYTVDQQIGTTRLDDAAITYTTTRDLRVGEARAVLVSR